jgi:hypothetical protein
MDTQLQGWDARLRVLEAQVEASRVLREDITRRLDEVRDARDEYLGSLQAGLALAWRRFTAQLGGSSVAGQPRR